MNKLSSKKNNIAIGVFMVAVLSRLLPHAPNFTPLEAIAIFGGAFLANKYVRFLLPIIALYIVDLVLNNTIFRSFFTDQEGLIFYSDYMLWNAIAIVGIVLLGRKLTSKISFLNIGLTAVAASVLFFMVTNFGAWLGSPLYAKDLSGMMACYIAAIPFFKTSLLSTLVFSYVMVGGYAWYKKGDLAIA